MSKTMMAIINPMSSKHSLQNEDSVDETEESVFGKKHPLEAYSTVNGFPMLVIGQSRDESALP